jgi:hypothetical protein
LAKLPGPPILATDFEELYLFKTPQDIKVLEESEVVWARKIIDSTTPYFLPSR